MRQRRNGLRFAFEARQTVRIRREQLRQHLDRDVAIELRIARAIDLAHAPCTNGGDDFVGAEACSQRQAHWLACCRSGGL
jgi:hypothetical protein